MDKKYIAPKTDIVIINLLNSILGEGDTGASGEADDDPWANKTHFDDSEDFSEEIAGRKNLWE